MKHVILAVATSCLIASPAHAVPITWLFNGTTSSSSQFNGNSIAGLDYELRVFLDTDIVGFDPPNLSDIMFNGPHQAEVEIETLGVLPVNMIPWVEYFVSGGGVTAVQLRTPFFHGIMFPSSITSDFLHLTPIPPTATSGGGLSMITPLVGPNGLSLSGPVATFSATLSETAVPEGGSTALLFASALAALGFLRRRIMQL
jgi:hypothetical protein